MNFHQGEKTKDGYLAVPPSGFGPGILVLHAWWGLNAFFTGLCDRLAGEGFVALAPDLFGGAVASTIPEAEVLRDAHDADAERVQTQVLDALDALRRHPSVRGSAVGTLACSLGAWWAVQLSLLRPEVVTATVLFYGAAEADFGAASCAYQGHFGENDEWEPLGQVRAMEAKMRAAGRDVMIHVYRGAGHWFLESDRPDAYNADAAGLAWDRTLSFLRAHLPQTA